MEASSDKAPIVGAEESEYQDNPDGLESDRDVPQQRSIDLQSLVLLELKFYKRRWFILGLFGLLACHQCIGTNKLIFKVLIVSKNSVWNTFGTI